MQWLYSSLSLTLSQLFPAFCPRRPLCVPLEPPHHVLLSLRRAFSSTNVLLQSGLFSQSFVTERLVLKRRAFLQTFCDIWRTGVPSDGHAFHLYVVLIFFVVDNFTNEDTCEWEWKDCLLFLCCICFDTRKE